MHVKCLSRGLAHIKCSSSAVGDDETDAGVVGPLAALSFSWALSSLCLEPSFLALTGCSMK